MSGIVLSSFRMREPQSPQKRHCFSVPLSAFASYTRGLPASQRKALRLTTMVMLWALPDCFWHWPQWQATVATQAKNEAQANEKKAVAAEGRVKEALDLAEQDRDRAVQSARELRKQVYVLDIGLAHRAVEDGDLGRAQALLGKHQPNPTEEDLRGIEWRHLWSRSQGNFEADLGPYVGLYSGLTISPDGQFVAVNRLHPTRVEVIHLASGRVAKSIESQDSVHTYSPSGNVLLGELKSGKGIVGWDARTWEAREPFQCHSRWRSGT